MAEERLIYADLKDNSYKYWNGSQTGTTVVCNWGRVGVDRGQSKIFDFSSDYAAENFLKKKAAEKLRKGYTYQKTLGKNAITTTGNVAFVAKVQIEHSNDPETEKLIDFLVTRNIHLIEGTTSIKVRDGQLTTPLGPLTTEGLVEAQALLKKIAAQRGDFPEMVNQYLRIVPRKLGAKRIDPVDLFGNPRKIIEEQNLLDSLGAVSKDLTDKAVVDGPRVFETKLSIIDGTSNDFARINKFYEYGRNNRHKSYRYRLRKVWRMEIEFTNSQFVKQIGNIQELWHGTSDVNLLSILKNGLIITSRNSGIHITGRLFGSGIYFSDQSTKSLNYCTSFWGGGNSQRCFMLLNDVALGKTYTPRGSISRLPDGYDSCFAKAGVSGVLNNEMIVYKTSQVRPTYLCEFIQ